MLKNINYKFKRFLLLLALSMATFSINAQQIRFEQAWELLQEKNNSIAAQRANVERYQQLQDASQALNYPSVSLGASYSRVDDNTDDILNSLPTTIAALLSDSTLAEENKLKSSITAMWAIYTGGKITAAHDYSAAQSAEAVAQLKMETQKRYEDLSRYFYSVVLAKEVLDTRRSVEQGLTKHRDFSIKLEEQGQIARVEHLQAEASLAKAVVDRRRAEQDLEIATSALTDILNQKSIVTPESSLFINRSLPPLSAFTEEALQTYPGLALLDAKQDQAKSSIKAEKSKYYPQVFLYGDYVLYEDDSFASSITPDWYVGIGVSIPLFDNSGRSEKVVAAESAVLQVRYLYQQAIQDLSVLVKKTYFEAQQAIEEVQGLESNLALAEENLNLRAKAFNQGLSTSIDVVDAELFLADIKIQQQVAKFNYVIALNKLLSLSSKMSTFTQYELTAIKSDSVKDLK
jgi:outer membrane protein TolC